MRVKTVLFQRGSKPTAISLFHVSSSQILLYFTFGKGGGFEDENERNCYSLSLPDYLRLERSCSVPSFNLA